MCIKREDFLPQYSKDLFEKSKRVRKVIQHLVDYDIEEIADVTPEEYNIIKLAVVNSIKGEVIASEETSRQAFVENVFLKPAKRAGILSYQDLSSTEKCDFQGKFISGLIFGLEVKGGEGNSVTLLYRPPESDIFAVWSHLDVMSNTPYENMRSVLGRVVKQMVNRDDRRQHVNYLIFYDRWYRTGIKKFSEGEALPDVFVFPEKIPTKTNPNPPLPNIKEDMFLKSLYRFVGNHNDLNDLEVRRHIWNCEIKILQINGKWNRQLKVTNELYPELYFFKSGTTTTNVKAITS